MPENSEHYDYESVRDLLGTWERLARQTDRDSKREFLDIGKRLSEAYDGPCHAEIHRALMDYLSQGDDLIIAELLCVLRVPCRVPCRDLLELTIRMTFILMQVAEWDGACSMGEISKFREEEYVHVYSSLFDCLSTSQHTPRRLLDQLNAFLVGDDHDLARAALLYISHWIDYSPKPEDLEDFFPDLERQFAHADAAAQELVRQIREGLEYQRKKLGLE